MNEVDKLCSRFYGCLVGGAIGDSFGYTVEFLSLDEIKAKYGKYGLVEPVTSKDNKLIFSDDTQMTLFTTAGLINGLVNHKAPLVHYVYEAYQDWYMTQNQSKGYKPHTWLYDIKELHEYRHPGRTCLASLSLHDDKHIYNLINPINDSKGCGAVMRVAPVGLIASRKYDPFILAAEVGALTHGHPMSHLSCQLMAFIIRNILKDDGRTLWRVVKDSIKELYDRYNETPEVGLEIFYERNKEYLPSFIDLMRKALIFVKYDLGVSGIDDLDNAPKAIKELGLGWVAEEALAIAIYSAVRYQNMPLLALRAASNHDGDSDSTASLTGQILGAYWGERDIPLFIFDKVELTSEIGVLAKDLMLATKKMRLNPSDKIEYDNKYKRK